jgi:hypothetical protein
MSQESTVRVGSYNNVTHRRSVKSGYSTLSLRAVVPHTVTTVQTAVLHFVVCNLYLSAHVLQNDRDFTQLIQMYPSHVRVHKHRHTNTLNQYSYGSLVVKAMFSFTSTDHRHPKPRPPRRLTQLLTFRPLVTLPCADKNTVI